jgi:hypothetical protein
VFALFFPVPLAIGATAVVHLANNVFKFGLLARHADWRVVLRFALPAALAAMGGAGLLAVFVELPMRASFRIGSATFYVTPLKAAVGLLIIAFALLEQWPRFRALAFPPRWLPLGGILSGFFGGFTGNQGALRSAFLLKAGLTKDAFIATGVVAAVIVDVTRLSVYGTSHLAGQLTESPELMPAVLAGVVCAIIGSYAGRQVLHSVTLRGVQLVVAGVMLLIGLGLVSGLL